MLVSNLENVILSLGLNQSETQEVLNSTRGGEGKEAFLTLPLAKGDTDFQGMCSSGWFYCDKMFVSVSCV